MRTLSAHRRAKSVGRGTVLACVACVLCFGGTAPVRATAQEKGAAGDTAIAVSIDNFTFSPASITVAPGTTVKWTNKDDVPHTVTSTDKSFASGALDTDASFSHQFKAPGVYSYFCSVHTHMTGQVIVK